MKIASLKVSISENLHQIVGALESEHNMKFTHIAKAMGYTTTTQLNNAMGATSMISTKAVINLIHNLNVSPTFLFLGVGSMFLTDETETEVLLQEKAEWERKYRGVEQELRSCRHELDKAVRRYNKLIDITSIALEKTQKSDSSSEENQEEK